MTEVSTEYEVKLDGFRQENVTMRSRCRRWAACAPRWKGSARPRLTPRTFALRSRSSVAPAEEGDTSLAEA